VGKQRGSNSSSPQLNDRVGALRTSFISKKRTGRSRQKRTSVLRDVAPAKWAKLSENLLNKRKSSKKKLGGRNAQGGKPFQPIGRAAVKAIREDYEVEGVKARPLLDLEGQRKTKWRKFWEKNNRTATGGHNPPRDLE